MGPYDQHGQFHYIIHSIEDGVSTMTEHEAHARNELVRFSFPLLRTTTKKERKEENNTITTTTAATHWPGNVNAMRLR